MTLDKLSRVDRSLIVMTLVTLVIFSAGYWTGHRTIMWIGAGGVMASMVMITVQCLWQTIQVIRKPR